MMATAVADQGDLDAERLAAVISALRAGAAPDVAWNAWNAGSNRDLNAWHRDDSLGLSLRAADSLAHHTGAPLAEILEQVALAHAGWQDSAERRDAALAGPRASARTLMWLPAVGVLLGALIEPSSLTLLVATILGWVLLLVSAALVWAAHRWMRSMLVAAEQAGSPP